MLLLVLMVLLLLMISAEGPCSSWSCSACWYGVSCCDCCSALGVCFSCWSRSRWRTVISQEHGCGVLRGFCRSPWPRWTLHKPVGFNVLVMQGKRHQRPLTWKFMVKAFARQHSAGLPASLSSRPSMTMMHFKTGRASCMARMQVAHRQNTKPYDLRLKCAT